jgi:hypothetical protein
MWDLIAMLIICYQAITIPYRFCFKARAFGPFKIYEFLMDIFFMFDMGLSFVTGYYKRGNLIMKRGPIMRHYLRTWFIVDLLATIPWSWLVKDRMIDYWPDDDFDETAELNDDDWNIYVSTEVNGSGGFISKVSRLLVDTSRYMNLSESDMAQALRLMKLIRFIRVIKLTQIFKLRKLIYRYEWFFFNDKIGIVIDFLKIFLFIFFFVHWLACLFF